LTVPGEPQRVIVPAGNRLYALDAATGAVIWSSARRTARSARPRSANPNIVGEPRILLGDQAGTLFSLDPRTGRVVATVTAGGAISGSAICDSDAGPHVFLGDGGGNIYAFDESEEFPSPVWRAALGGPIDGSPVLANGVLYAAANPQEGDAQIAALDAASGRLLFDAALPGGPPRRRSSPTEGSSPRPVAATSSPTTAPTPDGSEEVPRCERPESSLSAPRRRSRSPGTRSPPATPAPSRPNKGWVR
jgi:outer membrane protein assembly factor BamB